MIEEKETDIQQTDEKTENAVSEEPKAVSCESTSAPIKSGKKSKTQKVLTPKQRKRKTVILSSVIGVVCALFGGVGGYMLYQVMNPAKDPGVVEVLSGNGGGFEPTNTTAMAKSVEKSVGNGTVVKDFSSRLADLINYSFYMKAISPYSLTIGKSIVNATSLGITVRQDVQSTTFSTPDENFNENISSSSMIHTANRFYDKNIGKIDCYLCSRPSEWNSSLSPESVDYDTYIQENGKLIKGQYYVTDYSDAEKEQMINDRMNSGMNEATAKYSVINDKFLTSEEQEYLNSSDESKRAVQGEVIYLISSSTIADGSSIVQNQDETYTINLNLTNVSAYYYGFQMKKTGGLNTYPGFYSTELQFVLDKDLKLVSSFFKDHYVATALGMKADTTQEMTQYYFQSETNTFTKGNTSQEVTIPSMSEVDFNGYNLWPDE